MKTHTLALVGIYSAPPLPHYPPLLPPPHRITACIA